jgi:hypothetical protein
MPFDRNALAARNAHCALAPERSGTAPCHAQWASLPRHPLRWRARGGSRLDRDFLLYSIAKFLLFPYHNLKFFIETWLLPLHFFVALGHNPV